MFNLETEEFNQMKKQERIFDSNTHNRLKSSIKPILVRYIGRLLWYKSIASQLANTLEVGTFESCLIL